MSAKLKILIRTINRRIASGEELETILLYYKKLSEDEKTAIIQTLDR